MSGVQKTKLLVCYIPGLDFRRVTPANSPYLHHALSSYPSVRLNTLPSTELLPTLLTGVYPHEHGVWQVELKPEARSSPPRRVQDRVPDVLMTTLQCFRQLFDSSYDLAAIPNRRRRFFQQHRFKYTRRERSGEVLARIGSYDSIFGILRHEARYLFTKDFRSLDSLVAELPSNQHRLEFLEMYAWTFYSTGTSIGRKSCARLISPPIRSSLACTRTAAIGEQPC